MSYDGLKLLREQRDAAQRRYARCLQEAPDVMPAFCDPTSRQYNVLLAAALHRRLDTAPVATPSMASSKLVAADDHHRRITTTFGQGNNRPVVDSIKGGAVTHHVDPTHRQPLSTTMLNRGDASAATHRPTTTVGIDGGTGAIPSGLASAASSSSVRIAGSLPAPPAPRVVTTNSGSSLGTSRPHTTTMPAQQQQQQQAPPVQRASLVARQQQPPPSSTGGGGSSHSAPPTASMSAGPSSRSASIGAHGDIPSFALPSSSSTAGSGVVNAVESMKLKAPGQRVEPDFLHADETVNPEYSAPAEDPQHECTTCGRRFVTLDRLERHAKSCSDKPRSQFDVAGRRVAAIAETAGVDGHGVLSHGSDAKAGAKATSAKHKAKWRDQSAHLQAIMRAAQKGEAPPAVVIEDDRVECRGCGKKFAEETHRKHEAKCIERHRSGR